VGGTQLLACKSYQLDQCLRQNFLVIILNALVIRIFNFSIDGFTEWKTKTFLKIAEDMD
jgi:hypothetical protein